MVIHLYNKQFRMPSMCDVCDEKIQGRGGKLERKLRKFNKGGQKFFFKLENWQLKFKWEKGVGKEEK